MIVHQTGLSQSRAQLLFSPRQLQCRLQQILRVWRWTLICKIGRLNLGTSKMMDDNLATAEAT